MNETEQAEIESATGRLIVEQSLEYKMAILASYSRIVSFLVTSIA